MSIKMKNIKMLFLAVFCCFTVYNCAAPDFYTIEDVEKEKVKMEKGKTKSAETLLEIYKDIKQLEPAHYFIFDLIVFLH